jgi:hypothetical protein
MSGKPVFVFFKMFNCGHCTQFAEMPTAEKSPWAELLKDQELQNSVEFVRYDFGIETKGGQTVKHKLPDQYSFVNYGPYFYLHGANGPEYGLEFTPAEAQKRGRTAQGLKSWIKDSLKTNAKLTSSQAPQPVAVQAPQPVAKSPVSRVTNGLTSSGFQAPKPDLRPVANPSPIPVANPAQAVRNSKIGPKVAATAPTEPQKLKARNRRR